MKKPATVRLQPESAALEHHDIGGFLLVLFRLVRLWRLQIERDAASIVASMKIIHGGKYRVMINHQVEFVTVVPL